MNLIMKRNEIKVLILRVPGTNCDWETKIVFEYLGTKPEIHTFNSVVNGKVSIHDYQILVIPGGFSYGDFIRAGAVWGKKIMSKIGHEIKKFVYSDEKPIIGICNGFQVLLETSLLPGIEDVKITLTTNLSNRYECRWTFLKYVNSGKCKILNELNRDYLLKIPIGHGEGRLIVKSSKDLNKLIENDLIIFRYCKSNGEFANNEYPWNPNGSIFDIAGICDYTGLIVGMMPHPERAFFKWQYPDWAREDNPEEFGDGYLVLNSIVKYIEKKF